MGDVPWSLELGACVTFLWARPTPLLGVGSTHKLNHSVSNCETSNLGISSIKIEVEMQMLYKSEEK